MKLLCFFFGHRWIEKKEVIVVKRICERCSIMEFKRKNHKYLLDYSPMSELNISTCLKLFIGKNVPGKTRVVYINDKTNNNKDLIKKWVNELHKNKQSGKFPIRYCKLNKMIKEWDESFNLYHHNCRHFSNYIMKSC